MTATKAAGRDEGSCDGAESAVRGGVSLRWARFRVSFSLSIFYSRVECPLTIEGRPGHGRIQPASR